MKKPSVLDLEIERLEALIQDSDSGDKEYYRYLAHLDKLYDMRIKLEKKFNVDSNTLVVAGANILGILLILQHENLHAVSSKALSFVMKLKP